MRTGFDEQLAELHRQLIRMGALCEQAIGLAAGALSGEDPAKAAGVPALAAVIDKKERQIEALCMRLLLQQQPVARDLRAISSALKMVTDLERIGDNAGDIAEVLSLGNLPARLPGAEPPLQRMAAIASGMVTGSIDAFVRGDLGLARAVIARDDEADGCFDAVKAALIAQLRRPESRAQDAEAVPDLLMVAKYLERMADHAAQIAGWVVFALTGEYAGPQADRPGLPGPPERPIETGAKS